MLATITGDDLAGVTLGATSTALTLALHEADGDDPGPRLFALRAPPPPESSSAEATWTAPALTCWRPTPPTSWW